MGTTSDEKALVGAQHATPLQRQIIIEVEDREEEDEKANDGVVGRSGGRGAATRPDSRQPAQTRAGAG